MSRRKTPLKSKKYILSIYLALTALHVTRRESVCYAVKYVDRIDRQDALAGCTVAQWCAEGNYTFYRFMINIKVWFTWMYFFNFKNRVYLFAELIVYEKTFKLNLDYLPWVSLCASVKMLLLYLWSTYLDTFLWSACYNLILPLLPSPEMTWCACCCGEPKCLPHCLLQSHLNNKNRPRRRFNVN